jgi:low temperature requirement protein LtrA
VHAVEAQDDAGRVTTLELFFDLVFVFTITQLTAVLAHDASLRGALQVLLMLGVIWWMYGGYVWLTNAVAPDRGERRGLLLGGMAAFLIVALAIPRAFSDGGIAFGIAYLVVIGVHTALFARGTRATTLKAVLGLAPYNVASAAMVLAGGLAGGTAQYVLWALAFALQCVTPRLIHDAAGFEIAPGHFAERHGLVVLIALGESVVAVGYGAAGARLDLQLAFVAALALALSAALWWAYFGDGDHERIEAALAEAPAAARPKLAIYGFHYWHGLMLLGVIAIAAAEKDVVAHPFDSLAARRAILLAAGAAAFLLGDILFRRTLGIAQGRSRAAAVPLSAATAPLGLVAAVVQLGALVALLVAALASERRAPTISAGRTTRAR